MSANGQSPPFCPDKVTFDGTTTKVTILAPYDMDYVGLINDGPGNVFWFPIGENDSRVFELKPGVPFGITSPPRPHATGGVRRRWKTNEPLGWFYADQPDTVLSINWVD